MEGILIHSIDLVCSYSFYLCTVLLLSYTFVKFLIPIVQVELFLKSCRY